LLADILATDWVPLILYEEIRNSVVIHLAKCGVCHVLRTYLDTSKVKGEILVDSDKKQSPVLDLSWPFNLKHTLNNILEIQVLVFKGGG